LSLSDCGPECQQALAEIERFLDGELDPGARVFVERHISGCDPCTERVYFRRRVRELIATKCAGEQVPADLRARIQELLGGIARS